MWWGPWNSGLGGHSQDGASCSQVAWLLRAGSFVGMDEDSVSGLKDIVLRFLPVSGKSCVPAVPAHSEPVYLLDFN